MVATSLYRGITLHYHDAATGEATSLTILGSRSVEEAVGVANTLELPPSFDRDSDIELLSWERAYQFLPALVDEES